MKRFLLLFACVLSSISMLRAQAPAPAGAAKYPGVIVQVGVGTQQRPQPGSFYKKTMNISPKFTLEGSSRLVPLPAAEATMMIITMDTAAKYKAGEEVYKVHTTETIPVPAAANGNKRQFAFAESSVTYDSYRDTSNVGGEVYKYYIFALRDAASKEIVDFKTNNMQLQNYAKANPDKRAELLAMATGGKFPAVFK